MSTFTLPSRQTFSFSPHSPPCSLVVPSLALSFSPHPPPCSLISHDSPVPIILSLPSALSSYLPASLDLSAHTLFAHAFSLLSLPFHSLVPLFFLSLSSSLFRPSPFFPLRIFSPFSILSFILFSFILIHRFFFFPHLPHFLFPFRPCIRLAFSVPLSRLSLSFHTHTLTPLSPLFLLYSPSSRLSFSLFFHIHRPFFRASRCPSLQKQSCRTFLYGTKKRKAAASRFLIATIC